MNPAQNNYTNEALGANDPYAAQFSKTDASAMSSMIKSGSLDFGELKSGGSASGYAGGSPGFGSESDKQRQTSPRSPVGRRDKKPQDFVTKQQKPKSPPSKDDKTKNDGKQPASQKLLTKKESAPPNPAPPVSKEKIGQFYFPTGKPISKEKKQETELAIQKAFEGKTDLGLAEFETVVVDVCKIPKIFKKLLFERIKKTEKMDEKAEKISK